jgi:hypothetical protein
MMCGDISVFPIDSVVAAAVVSNADLELLAPAILDSLNPPLSPWEQANFSNALLTMTALR